MSLIFRFAPCVSKTAKTEQQSLFKKIVCVTKFKQQKCFMYQQFYLNKIHFYVVNETSKIRWLYCCYACGVYSFYIFCRVFSPFVLLSKCCFVDVFCLNFGPRIDYFIWKLFFVHFWIAYEKKYFFLCKLSNSIFEPCKSIK